MKIVHFGCGPCIIKSPTAEWVNIDHGPQFGADVCMDYLKVSEMFGENYFDFGLAIHTTEHLFWPSGVQKFFSEAKKVLKPGGRLRIVVPDLKKVATKYVNGEDLKDIYDGPYWTYQDQPATRFMEFCRGWSHTIIFDEQLLRSLADEAGFTDFKVMPFGVSAIPELCNRDRFKSESLSAEMRA